MSPPTRAAVDCGEGPFATDADAVADAGDPTAYCLPVARASFGDYALTVDGAPYAGPVGGCDNVSHLFYNYAPIFEDGADGPFALFEWRIDGEFDNGTFEDVASLLSLMRSIDPGGDWTLDADNFNIVGGDPDKDYSALTITDDGTGARTELLPNPIETALGTRVELPGAGVYRLVLTETATGCEDALTLTIGAGVPERPTDTVRVTSFGDSPFTACAELPFPAPFTAPTFCGTDGPYVASPANGSCVTIDPTDGTSAGGSVCVEWCSGADPRDCQRVLFVIARVPACAADLLGPDTLRLPATDGPALVCLGDGVDLSGYTVTVDGTPVTPMSSPDCGSGAPGAGGTETVYAYDAVFLGDNALRIDGWDIDGTLVSGVTVDDLQGLADTMSALDPSATWRYDEEEAAILADTDEGNYSMLILFDLVGGFAANLLLERRDIVSGSGGDFVGGAQITIPGPGAYEIVVTDEASGCVDRQIILRAMAEGQGPTRDTVRHDITAGQLGGPFCLDVSQLPGAPTSLESCGDPANGTIAYTPDYCYTYRAAPGFTGLDRACVVVCSGNGATCDTTDIIFDVRPGDDPGAGLPTRDTLTQDVRADRLNGPYCLNLDQLPRGALRRDLLCASAKRADRPRQPRVLHLHPGGGLRGRGHGMRRCLRHRRGRLRHDRTRLST